MVKLSNNSDQNTIQTIIKNIYLPTPLIKFMARHPFRAALIAHIAGFWSLFLGNWLNGSLIWSSPRKYDYTFLSNLLDWLYLGLLLPGAFWAMAQYYRALYEGIQRLTAEGIIKTTSIQKLSTEWKTRKAIRLFLWMARYIVPLILIGFTWWAFPSWCPQGKIIWFMTPERTPNIIGYLFLFLGAILVLLTFAYLVDTVRFAIFHFHLIHQDKAKNRSSDMAFFPQHPDGAFGYTLLAPSMDWAGILGLFVLTVIIVAIASKVAITGITEEKLIDPTLAVNSLLCFIFFPWIVLGPVFPFILMLSYRKRDYLLSLRTRLAEYMPETSLHSRDINSILKEWECVDKGRPYILGKKSIFIIVASILITQIIRISGVLVYLAKINLSL